LIELLCSIAVLAVLMTLVFAVFNQASKAWVLGEGRTETFQGARLALEMMGRELEGARAESASPTGGGKKITFLTFQDANTVPGGVAGIVATPPNDQVFFIANAPDSRGQDVVDFNEYGYLVVFAQVDTLTMKGGQYYLLRHDRDSAQPTWDFFDFPLTWHETPGVSTGSKTPILEHVLRFELQYEQLGGSGPSGTETVDTWSDTEQLPRAVHITMCVLDRRLAKRVSAITGGTGLSAADLANVPDNIDLIANEGLKNTLREGVRTFYRTVYPRNAS
jgi:type II secretory pathway pseudopilin PulG